MSWRMAIQEQCLYWVHNGLTGGYVPFGIVSFRSKKIVMMAIRKFFKQVLNNSCGCRHGGFRMVVFAGHPLVIAAQVPDATVVGAKIESLGFGGLISHRRRAKDVPNVVAAPAASSVSKQRFD